MVVVAGDGLQRMSAFVRSSLAALMFAGCYTGLEPEDPPPEGGIAYYPCENASACGLTRRVGGFFRLSVPRRPRTQYLQEGELERVYIELPDNVCSLWCIADEETLYRCCGCNERNTACEYCLPIQACE